MLDIHLEERMGVTKRIDDRSETHGGFDGVRTEINGFRAEMNCLSDRMETMFRWTISLLLINWLTLLAGIFLVALKK